MISRTNCEKGNYRKCSNKRPGRLFNFLGREGGANSKGSAYWKGGAYFVFFNFWSQNDTIFSL